MCKYCEFTNIEELSKDNENQSIKKIVDGCITTELSLMRYQDGTKRVNQLVLNRYLTEGRYDVDYHNIDIMYCPFCGEKL